MLNDKEIAQMDQAISLVSETLPPLWWNLYNNLVKEGFTPEQAFDLLKSYITSMLAPGN